jgi:hypothetical protein
VVGCHVVVVDRRVVVLFGVRWDKEPPDGQCPDLAWSRVFAGGPIVVESPPCAAEELVGDHVGGGDGGDGAHYPEGLGTVDIDVRG